MSQKEEIYSPCLKCGRPGIERCDETLPDNGTLIKVVHDDGSVCEFEEYPSVTTFFNRKRRKRDPQMMDCPVCGQEGRVSYYKPTNAKQFHTWKYYIVHEPIEGYWGKNHKTKKHRRCYMKTQDQRNQVLKKLERYKS